MKDKIYPAIYEAVDGNRYVHLDTKNYYSYERECWDVSNGDDSHSTDKNITHEYLQNTYGEVVSPEHAEFIVELAEGAGLEVIKWPSNQKMFSIRETYGKLTLNLIGDGFPKSGLKQITIPLPPKQIQTATPEEEFEMKQIEKSNRYIGNVKENNNTKSEARATKIDNDTVTITVDKPLKNAGDNLVLGCEDSKCDEWPCVGDDVTVRIDAHQWDVKYGHNVDGMNGVVRSIFEDGDVTVYAVSVDGVCYCFVRGLLQKPKTTEEELRDELAESFCAAGYETDKYIDYLMSKYKITKKPQ